MRCMLLVVVLAMIALSFAYPLAEEEEFNGDQLLSVDAGGEHENESGRQARAPLFGGFGGGFGRPYGGYGGFGRPYGGFGGYGFGHHHHHHHGGFYG